MAPDLAGRQLAAIYLGREVVPTSYLREITRTKLSKTSYVGIVELNYCSLQQPNGACTFVLVQPLEMWTMIIHLFSSMMPPLPHSTITLTHT